MKRNISHLSTADKLRELAVVLEKVQPENFNMGAWGYCEDELTLDVLTSVPVMDCGTAACAAGAAACAFEGLDLIRTGAGDWDIRAEGPNGPDWCIFGFEAASVFFGISREDAHNLFAPGCYDCEPLGSRGIKRERVIGRLLEMAQKYEDQASGAETHCSASPSDRGPAA